MVAGYVTPSRRDADGTTEEAALVVLAAGVSAGLGALALASGIIAVRPVRRRPPAGPVELVLLFSGRSFVGWAARRLLGSHHRAPVAGLPGGPPA